MKEASRRVLPIELRKASPKIILHADGTFVASDLPGLFYFPERHPLQLETGAGVWRIGSRRSLEEYQEVQLDFQVLAGWKGAFPIGTQLAVSRGSLFYFLGDPDSGRRVAFEKK